MKTLSTDFEAQRERLDLVGSRLGLIDGRLDRLETSSRERLDAIERKLDRLLEKH